MNNYSGLLIGGLVPAIAFGIGALFQKQSNDIGIGQSYYLIFFSAGLLIAALVAHFILKNNTFSLEATFFASAHGLFFGIGFVCLAIGLSVYQQPISKLVPLVNMSTIVTVLLGLIIFSEYLKVNIVPLISGSILIILGGILVAKA